MRLCDPTRVRRVAYARLASRSDFKRVITLGLEFDKMVTGRLLLVTLLCAGVTAVYGQEMSPTAHPQQQQPIMPVETDNNVPLYRIQVVGRDIPAINYWHRSGSTKIGFAGTSLLPQGKGEASVTSKGQSFIDAKFEGFVPANSFGVEYLTYVLWAITPQGRPVNLGEVMPGGSKAEMKVTTNLQQFALIITAEPYFAVTTPSDLVVMQNTVNKDKTTGIIDTVNVHFNLLPRGAYVQTAGQHAVLNPVKPSDKSPLQLYEAINAVQIAEATGAAQHTPDILAKAKQELENAQALDGKNSQRKVMITYARGAVQDAEDARVSTLRKLQQEKEHQQQVATQQARDAAQQAQAEAQQEALKRAQADAAASQAEASAANARAAQAAAEHDTQQATDQTEQMRERLRAQLGQVLQTQETARGLIVNLSDVLFDTAKYTLKPEAREKLSKVSGILLAYPNLKVQVEGYTDNIGGDQYNLTLSQQRGDAVRTYLISQSVGTDNITATGYGMSNPIADNTTAAGRAQNRRVQMVVSGSAIGVQQIQPSAANPPQGGMTPVQSTSNPSQ
jgi:outer membrane protein OmpA-like peptidoglycan-associated protein